MNSHSHYTDPTNKKTIEINDICEVYKTSDKDPDVVVKYIVHNNERYYYFGNTFTDYYIKINQGKKKEFLTYNFFLPVQFDEVLEDMNSRRWCIPYFDVQEIEGQSLIRPNWDPRRCMGSGFLNMFLQFDWEINNFKNDDNQTNFRINKFKFNDCLRPNQETFFIPAAGFADEGPMSGSIMDYYIRITEDDYRKEFEEEVNTHIKTKIDNGYKIGDENNNGLMGLPLAGFENSYPHYDPIMNIRYFDYMELRENESVGKWRCRL